jgi:hypothetical protein
LEFDRKRLCRLAVGKRHSTGEEARAFARNVWVAIYVIAAIVLLFIILR